MGLAQFCVGNFLRSGIRTGGRVIIIKEEKAWMFAMTQIDLRPFSGGSLVTGSLVNGKGFLH